MNRSKPWQMTAITLWLVSGSVMSDMVDISHLQPWEPCAFCHGVEGASANPRFPHLAGQKSVYLERQLRAFQQGLRSNDGGVMQSMAEALTPQDISLLADYFATQKASVEVTAGTPERSTDWARAVFLNGLPERQLPACGSCHGDNGLPQAPRLTGQHEDYLVKQLDEFSAGVRVDLISGANDVSDGAGKDDTEAGPADSNGTNADPIIKPAVSMNEIARRLTAQERRWIAVALANWDQSVGNTSHFLQ